MPVDPAPTPSLTEESVILPQADVWQALVDDGLALLDRTAGRVTVLNASVALIFTAFDGVRPLHAVVDQLVGETGGDRASIASDVEATVARLVAAGIVDIGVPLAQAPSGDHRGGRSRSPESPRTDRRGALRRTRSLGLAAPPHRGRHHLPNPCGRRSARGGGRAARVVAARGDG